MRVHGRHMLCGWLAATLLAGCAANSVDAVATATSSTPTAAATSTVPPAPASPRSRIEQWIALQVGDCVADLPPIDLSRVTVTVVDCGTAHLGEVYLRAPVAVDNAIATVANRNCADGFTSYTGQSVAGSAYSVTYLIDSNQDRTGANPTPSTVICLLQSVNGQLLTGSARR